MAKLAEISRDQLIPRLQNFYTDLAREVDRGFIPQTAYPDLEIIEQRELSRERIGELLAQTEANVYPPYIPSQSEALIGCRPHDFKKLPLDAQADVNQGVARAEIEQLRLLMFRLSDRLSNYVPTDPLFASAGVVHSAQQIPLQMPAPNGASLKTVVAHYLQSGKSKWTAKTLAGKSRVLEYLLEHIGEDTPLAAITPDMVRSFKVAITRLRSNHKMAKAQSFAEKQTVNEKLRIAPKTVLNIYNPARAFFTWATNVEGYLATPPPDPAGNIKVETPKRIKGQKPRRPFNAEELTKLFSAPPFTGSHSGWMLLKPGPTKVRADHFWIPILSYYTGCRLGELVQLHLRDVITDGPIPYIEITEETDEKGKLGSAKHVKSEAGIRKVPLHDDLIELGFLEFVAKRRKFKSSVRLFHKIKFGADGQASTVFSKWFARLCDSQGLTDPALTFHGFRHGMQDALRDAVMPEYVINRVFGHSKGTAAEEYGNGASLEVVNEALQSARLPVSVPTILKQWSA